MKKIWVVIFSFIICIYMSARISHAQSVPTPTPITPTPTSRAPTPTTLPTPATLTSQPTPTPEKPTDAPISLQNHNPTPTPLPTAEPTVTPKPKPLPMVGRLEPPPPPVARIITAPFDLVMQVLPRSYYSDQGLAQRTTVILLAMAFISISGGLLLLLWPRFKRINHNNLSFHHKEKENFQYLARG